ncbi:biorientation of chromosomes in cell division protein 1-like 1 [Pomacea canaliculata]|uniref:biorientation of chromosomes in cell division protein 1-like 1 n=1 Tax=Pomacea canaliculata TaxID=400727 RepID=UPI000D725EAA|nr:biorientation of chromosomes in cell division protein 1-like 1 [Pomacea canaliculata]
MPKSNNPPKKAKSRKDSENKVLPVECDEDKDVQVVSMRKTRSHAKTYNATKSSVNVTDAHISRHLKNQMSVSEVKVKSKTKEECKPSAMAAQRRGRSLLQKEVDSGLEQLQKRRQTVVKREKQASFQKDLLRGSRKRSSELAIKSSTNKKARPSVSKMHVEDDSFSETEHSHTDLDKNSKMSKLDKSADLKKSSRKSSRQQTKRTGKKESAAELCKRMTGRKKYSNLREKDSDKEIRHVEMHASSKDLEHSKEVDRNNLQVRADDARPHSGDLNIRTEESSSDSDFEDVTTDYRTPSTSPLSQTVISSGVSRKLESSFSEMEISPVKQNDLQLITDVPFTYMKNKKSENLPKEEKEISKCDSKGTKDSSSKQCKRNKLTLASSPDKVVGKFRPAVLTVDEMDVTAVLLKMEGKADQKAADVMSTSENSEESDWEEVEEYKHSPVKSQIPDAPVEITINDPTMLHKKREKKAFDWRKYVKQRIQRLARETQMEMHKVHLLCLLSHGMQQNSACNNEEARAFALSLISPEDLKKKVSKHTTESLQTLVKWFKMSFRLDNSGASPKISLISPTTISSAFAERTAHDIRLFVMMLIVFLRVMGFNVRLVMSLHPLPMKLSNAASNKGLQKKEKKSKSPNSSNSPNVNDKAESKISEKVSRKRQSKEKPGLPNNPQKNPKQIFRVLPRIQRGLSYKVPPPAVTIVKTRRLLLC